MILFYCKIGLDTIINTYIYFFPIADVLTNWTLEVRFSYSVPNKALFSVAWCLETGLGKGAAGGGAESAENKGDIAFDFLLKIYSRDHGLII